MTHKNPRVPRIWISIALAAWTLIVFWPALHGEFLRGDDEPYITKNAIVLSGINTESVKWAFDLEETHAAAWHPLTSISHMLDVELFGTDPFGHHLISLLLHVINTLLLFYILAGGTGRVWSSAVVAALFALHPLHVEAVAWISSRKDVLSTFFWLLTMAAYFRYARYPRPGTYLVALLFLALGLLSKPMVVTLPVVLLLMDAWPLGRVANLRAEGKTLSAAWGKLAVEKIPMLVLVAVASVLTFISQQSMGAVSTLEELPLSVRLENSLVAYAGYLGKTFFPAGLSPFYPHPGTEVPIGPVLLAAAALAAISGLVILRRKRPHLVVGWLWYLGILVPVIGIVQIGDHAMADRFTYIPLIGVFLMMVWAVPERWLESGGKRIWGRTVSVSVLLVLSVLTRVQVGYWQDTVSLYAHAVAVTEKNHFAHNNLAQGLQDQGRHEEAAVHYAAASELNPDWPEGHSNLGNILARLDRTEEALAAFNRALDLKRLQTGAVDQNTAVIHFNMGMTLVQAGRNEESIESLRTAVIINPDLAPAQYLLGTQLEAARDYQGAVSAYREALRVSPDSVPANNNLAVVLFYTGEYEAAWNAVTVCRSLGHEPPAEFIEALSERMSDPGSP